MRNKATRWLCLGTAGAVLCAIACVAQAPAAPARVEQWGMEEVTLHASPGTGNPFLDVTLSATFRHAGGEMTVAGFYDGNGIWKIRFMPRQRGAWTYDTHSSLPALDRRRGSFTVTAPGPRNHGPVEVAHTYHFSYADGTPLFVLGTTMYNWINRDDALQEETLRTLAHQPFNKVRFCIFPKWYAYNRVSPKFFPYVRNPDGSFAWDSFDVRYFHRLEQRILDLQRLGIQADIILFHPYDHWGFDEMGQQRDDRYLRYIAARLAAYRNVWWTMANEYDLFEPSLESFGTFTVKPRVPKDFDHLAQTLAASDPYHHLLGNHDIATWYDARKPWVTHAIDQDGAHRPDLAVPIARALYHKPVVVDEYGYEGNNGHNWGSLDARTALKEHWELTMAGGYGSHGETYVHPGGILWWAAGGTLVGDEPPRLAFLKQIMTQAPFQQLQPAPLQVMGGTALVGPDGYSLFYFEKPGPVQLQLQGSPWFRAELIDPWLMKIYPMGLVPAGVHKLEMRMVPELLRFVPVSGASPAGSAQAGTLRDRMESFAGELPSPPPTTPFTPEIPHLSDQYTLNLLLLNPTANALLHRLLPDMKYDGIQPALVLHDIAANPANHIDPKVYEEVQKELAKIPAY